METKDQVIGNIAALLFVRVLFSYAATWCLMFAILPVLFSLFIFDVTIGGEYLAKGFFSIAMFLKIVNGPDGTLDKDAILSILSKASLAFLVVVEGVKFIISRITKKKALMPLRYKILIATSLIIIVHILSGFALSFANFSNGNTIANYFIILAFCIISILGMLGYYGSHVLKDFFIKIFIQNKFISQ